MENKETILAKIAKYENSVNTGSTEAFMSLWADDPVSLTVSVLNLSTKQKIEDLFFKKVMLGKYSTRRLQINNIRLEDHGDMYVAVFTWTFDATLAVTGEDHHGEGIETQIYSLINGEWKLVHEHYHSCELKALIQ